MKLKTIDKMAIIYFFHVSPDMILKKWISYHDFPPREFEELLRCYDQEHSDTENHLIYQNMRAYTKSTPEERESNLNVFYDLVHVAEELLEISDSDIRCRYSELRRWREITRYLGEDMLICAFLVRKFKRYGTKHDWFCWDTVLGHTNQQLNAIMRQGISDNHFHLFGAAPVFQLIWLKLMNDVNMNSYVKGLQGIQGNRRNMHFHFDYNYGETSMECMILQAALMRAVMYAYLNGEAYIFDSGLSGEGMEKNLLGYLAMDERICDIQPEIREKINLLKAQAVMARSNNEWDYALNEMEYDERLNWIFSGERALVYGMLCDILVKRELPEFVQEMLYPYLVIRTILRGEIIQNNQNVGFENFAIYNGRKRNFLTAQKDTEMMVKHAVISSFKQGNMRSLEIRINPGNTYIENGRMINFYDRIITRDNRVEKDRFFYVFHFAKRNDKLKSKIILTPCRDHALRKKIRKQGFEILELRNRMPKEAERVHGIDACAQEIGCRPEVFGPVFRQLKYHVVSFDGAGEPGQLRITYHAGEDFLDMADGLRALDEAMKYLCMGSGDRFGHATVLGISVENWYKRKRNRIEIRAQDYLDNVVWLYQKILEFQLSGFDVLKDFLLHEFQRLFQQIYAKYIPEHIQTDIFTYYDAWKLRGDDPELYKDGEYKPKVLWAPGELPENPSYPEDFQIRYHKETAHLYYAYHFNENVRREGNCPLEILVSRIYIEGVRQVQAEIQREIAQKGIGIETNPSSNLLISTIADYDEHPIINLYNQGLKRKVENQKAQLYVSINTDDKGVFHTSLENEYALMASALENMTDENGRNLYSPQEVYDWVEKIRVMGNHQVFANRRDYGTEV